MGCVFLVSTWTYIAGDRSGLRTSVSPDRWVIVFL